MSAAPESVSVSPAIARKRRELLLTAAVELFDEMSFDAVTVDMVAERAQVARGLVAYYFGNKAGLYRAASTQYETVLREQLVENSHKNPARWIEADVNNFLDAVEAHPMAIRNATGGHAFGAVQRRTPMSEFTVGRLVAFLGPGADHPLVRLVITSWGLMCVDIALRWLDDPDIARADIAAIMVSSLRGSLAATSREHPEFGLPKRPFA